MRRRLLHGSCTRTGLCLASLGLVLAFACSDSTGPPSPAPGGIEGRYGSDPALGAFVAELRRAIEAGDALSMDALFNWEEMPEHLVHFTRMRLLPKGPMTVVDIRLEAMEEGGGPLIELEGVTYELNVVPVGTLFVDMQDVSIGALSKKMIVGRVGGEYRLAGMRPRG
jgi:hypothetical protein